MKNLMKGSRCEKRDSTDGLSADQEVFGPPAAIPFKWEEAPGKAKPKQEGEMDGELFKEMICMENCSGSLYRSVEAGNPKGPGRGGGVVALNPPPVLQSPERIASPLKGSGSPVKRSTSIRRWASQNLWKWMLHNHRYKASKDSYSRTRATQISVSQELEASKSCRISEVPAIFERARSSHGRLEFISGITSSSYSPETESARLGTVSCRGSGWSLQTYNNKSNNLQNPNPTEHQISDIEQNAANKAADLAQKSKDEKDKKVASEESKDEKDKKVASEESKDEKDKKVPNEGDEPLDFHCVIAEILNSEAAKEEMRSDRNNGEKREEVTVQRRTETNMELEIMMRFAQINVRKKKGILKMNAYKNSDPAQSGGLVGCLPVCLFGGPRRGMIYEDCLDSITTHCNAVSKSNRDLDRGF